MHLITAGKQLSRSPTPNNRPIPFKGSKKKRNEINCFLGVHFEPPVVDTMALMWQPRAGRLCPPVAHRRIDPRLEASFRCTVPHPWRGRWSLQMASLQVRHYKVVGRPIKVSHKGLFGCLFLCLLGVFDSFRCTIPHPWRGRWSLQMASLQVRQYKIIGRPIMVSHMFVCLLGVCRGLWEF